MYIRLICLELFSLSSFFLCSPPHSEFVYMEQQACHSHLATTDFPDFPDFVHASTYISPALSPRLFVNQSELRPAYLPSLPLLSSQHIYLTFSLLNPPPPNPLSTMAQPSINVTQKLLLCWVIRACTHVRAFLKHSALLRPLKAAASECGPPTSAAKGSFIVMHI